MKLIMGWVFFVLFYAKQIENHQVEWNVDSRVGSLDNAQHKPGGGDKKVKHGNH